MGKTNYNDVFLALSCAKMGVFFNHPISVYGKKITEALIQSILDAIAFKNLAKGKKMSSKC